MALNNTPPWFERAVATPFEKREVEVEGCPIRYLLWGDEGKPGLLLVHGNGAHAYWWSFIAPFFLDHYRVAAINLGGMGDSGYRQRYQAETFAAELMAVCDHAELGPRPIIVGHSFGGFISLKTGTLYGEQLTGVVLVDAPVRPPDYKWEFDPKRSPIRPKRYYPIFPR